MTDNQEVILIEKEQGASIRKMISSTLRKYHQPGKSRADADTITI